MKDCTDDLQLVRKALSDYKPCNEQELRDKAFIMNCIENMDNVFTRDNACCHITVSAWVLNKSCSKVLMAYHNIYNSWAWLGGHVDGNKNLQAVALKEAVEESSVKNVSLLMDEIFSVEVLTVDGHIKNGEYISSHLHLNFTYALQADENETISVKKDENSDVAWLSFDEIFEKSNEEWFKNNIYNKLVDKTIKCFVAAGKEF